MINLSGRYDIDFANQNLEIFKLCIINYHSFRICLQYSLYLSTTIVIETKTSVLVWSDSIIMSTIKDEHLHLLLSTTSS